MTLMELVRESFQTKGANIRGLLRGEGAAGSRRQWRRVSLPNRPISENPEATVAGRPRKLAVIRAVRMISVMTCPSKMQSFQSS